MIHVPVRHLEIAHPSPKLVEKQDVVLERPEGSSIPRPVRDVGSQFCNTDSLAVKAKALLTSSVT